ncbi:MAG TPA: hypothetical protein DCE24_06690 [Porphyromonadaceae bacterium]|nr:hypothetical protein [Porphyromonadaceae bacterium]
MLTRYVRRAFSQACPTQYTRTSFPAADAAGFTEFAHPALNIKQKNKELQNHLQIVGMHARASTDNHHLELGCSREQPHI